MSGDPDEDPSTFLDHDGLAMLQSNLVPLIMGCPSRSITQQFLEILSLMGKRYVQKEWPNLIPELGQYLAVDASCTVANLHNSKLALEAIKKICKKYRYMFRSDDLYREMNYMIENLSGHLLNNLMYAVTQLSTLSQTQGADVEQMRLLISTANSVLHIFESVLAQEELPDFYEENLEQISQACTYILSAEFPIMQGTSKDVEAVFRTKAKVVRLADVY